MGNFSNLTPVESRLIATRQREEDTEKEREREGDRDKERGREYVE